jgi:hypothetical protein
MRHFSGNIPVNASCDKNDVLLFHIFVIDVLPGSGCAFKYRSAVARITDEKNGNDQL